MISWVASFPVSVLESNSRLTRVLVASKWYPFHRFHKVDKQLEIKRRYHRYRRSCLWVGFAMFVNNFDLVVIDADA